MTTTQPRLDTKAVGIRMDLSVLHYPPKRLDAPFTKMLRIAGFFSLLLVLSFNFGLIVAASGRSCPRMKAKLLWGGDPAKEITYQTPPVEYAVIHHTLTDECSNFTECATILENIQKYHMKDLGYDDIAYNFLIGSDGMVYEGRGWGVRGAHTLGYNKNGIGIAFIGNFMMSEPSKAALSVAKRLLSCGVQSGDLSRSYRLIGACQVSGTQSPGLSVYNIIQKWKHWVYNP